MHPVAYLEHLTDPDIAFLVSVSRTGTAAGLREFLEENTDSLQGLLASDPVYEALFGAGHEEALLRASPFLVFAVLIVRAHAELRTTSFVQEWLGPARRVPLFEVATLRAFSADSAHQLFLAELLASYTRVVSGSFWVHTPRGWQRRRYSDLDLMRLVEMLNYVPDAERPVLLRRLGDLALFLSGVFPDFAGTHTFRPTQRRRLESAVNASESESEDRSELDFLEMIGSASYRQASIAAERQSGTSGTLREMAGGFGQARRVLNFVTDRYLYPFREQWFTMGRG
ncbi:MAG TPA: hypothetical protein VFB34_09240 [Chloroflexota bacterium]|nr:hypothetical protein [Chloroflexota bacterium]